MFILTNSVTFYLKKLREKMTVINFLFTSKITEFMEKFDFSEL